ncbi:flavin reductase family protein [Tyzzerella sp. OttesenSCG-928-J15]|nr:flavin reductase family protein [Tyzzerella sp. OttesenSCG-928-J15]
MSKTIWKPGSMLYPAPVVMVSCGDFENKKDMNIITVMYAGSACRDPHMLQISVRTDRYSYGIIKKYGEFVVNLTTEKLAFATDFCGVKSGKDIDKFAETGLSAAKSEKVGAPSILESPINIECRVAQIIEAGSHHIFLGEVLCVGADDQYLDEKGKFHLEKAKPICYSHGKYYGMGECFGGFGFSVRKKK